MLQLMIHMLHSCGVQAKILEAPKGDNGLIQLLIGEDLWDCTVLVHLPRSGKIKDVKIEPTAGCFKDTPIFFLWLVSQQIVPIRDFLGWREMVSSGGRFENFPQEEDAIDD
jgi:hypothetical protein